MSIIPICNNNLGKESSDAAKRANSILDRLSLAPLASTDIDALMVVYRIAKSARIKAEKNIQLLSR